VYPETKHPTYFRSIGLPLEEKLLASLEQAGWNRREAPVFIQSFETANLRELRKKTTVRLVQLVAFPATIDEAKLKDIASYADGIGAEKRLIVPVSQDGALQPGYAGIRPKTVPQGAPAQDFVVQGPADHGVPGLINLFGIESPGEHTHTPHRKPTRYVVVIDSAGSTIARLFLDSYEQVAEVDAGTEEIALMTHGLQPAREGGRPRAHRRMGGDDHGLRRDAQRLE